MKTIVRERHLKTVREQLGKAAFWARRGKPDLSVACACEAGEHAAYSELPIEAHVAAYSDVLTGDVLVAFTDEYARVTALLAPEAS